MVIRHVLSTLLLLSLELSAADACISAFEDLSDSTITETDAYSTAIHRESIAGVAVGVASVTGRPLQALFDLENGFFINHQSNFFGGLSFMTVFNSVLKQNSKIARKYPWLARTTTMGLATYGNYFCELSGNYRDWTDFTVGIGAVATWGVYDVVKEKWLRSRMKKNK